MHVCMYTVYIIFRQNFSDNKNLSPFQKKTLAETIHYMPKVLRKGNRFHGPFAQLSYALNYITFWPKFHSVVDLSSPLL